MQNQENLLYQKLQQAKIRGRGPDETLNLFKSTDKGKNVSDAFSQPEEVDYIEYSKTSTYSFKKQISITIPRKSGTIELELLEVPSSFGTYKITTSSGKNYKSVIQARHYRGIVKDDPESIAAISFYENEVTGWIITKDENINIAFDKESNKHLLYNDKNLKQKNSFVCETDDDPNVTYNESVLNLKSKATTSLIKCVRLYIETEYDIYQTKGSLNAVEV